VRDQVAAAGTELSDAGAQALGQGDAPVLVLTPQGRDAEVAVAVLGRVGVACRAYADLGALAAALTGGADAARVVVIAEEALLRGDLAPLRAALDAQPPWSDLPFVVLSRSPITARPDDPRTGTLADTLGNAVFLERPLRTATLAAAVRVWSRGVVVHL
jgi:hypothetical protein